MDNLRKHISKFSHKERRSIMKKEIKAPEMEVIRLLIEDVISEANRFVDKGYLEFQSVKGGDKWLQKTRFLYVK